MRVSDENAFNDFIMLARNWYLFRRILPIIILTFYALMRVSDEKAFTSFMLAQLAIGINLAEFFKPFIHAVTS